MTCVEPPSSTGTTPVEVARPEATTAQRVRDHVAATTPGEPFTVAEVSHLGTRAAVGAALGRMVTVGELTRVTRGMYAVPKFNTTLGRLVPVSPEQVLTALARSTGEKVGVHGAEAARRFGLSTQVAVHPVFLTTGRNRKVPLTGQQISLIHAPAAAMALAGTGAGTALTALLYLGVGEATAAVLAKVCAQLPAHQVEALHAQAPVLPTWLVSLLETATSTT